MVGYGPTVTAPIGGASQGFSTYRPTRIRPGRVLQQQILDLWENNEEPWQANYWARLDDSLHHLLGGPLRVDMRMATPDGWKPIGEAEVGDEVLSVDGKPTRIIGVYPQGTLGMYRVTFTDGAEVACDDSHSWTVISPNGTERTLQLKEIIEQGLFTTNGDGKRLHRHRIPVAAPLELVEADLPLDPYLLGYLIGDGSFVGTSPSLTCAEPEDEQPWREVLPDSISVTKWHQSDESKTPIYGLVYRKRHTNPITQALTNLGLWGKRDRFKSIPDAYLWASRAQRWALLQGLCDSDGYGNAGGMVEIATVSHDLAQDVIQLVQSLGGTARASLRPAKEREHHGYTDSACYRVSISLPGEEVPFRLRRKADAWRPRKVPIVRAIARVEQIEAAEAICIKVDREDGLFLTEGMVVTHNTRFILPDDFLWGVDGRQHMVVIFPQKITTPLKVINLLGNRRPKAMRYAVGLNLTAGGISTDVETWLNAVLEHDVDGRPLVNYRELVGRLLLEGAVVVKCISSDAHWRKSLTWLDLIEEEEYLDLPPRKQRRYLPEEEVDMTDEETDEAEKGWSRDSIRQRRTRPPRYVRVDRDGIPMPKSEYLRDARGRARDDGYYSKPRKDKDGNEIKWKEDRSASLRAFRKDQKEWLARRLPFEVEIISARHCIPLMDDNERLEAILVRRSYDPQEALARDLRWGDSMDMLTPNVDDEGEIVVYELWHVDERDRPYVSYFVEGYDETYFARTKSEADQGEEYVDAVIDLQREYGCTKLPIRWFWGLNFPLDDITQKAIPFLWPVLSSINAAEGLATAIHIYAWRNAFAGSFIQIDPAVLDRYGDLFAKNGDLFRFGLNPMENVVVPGRPQVASAPDPGAGVQQLLQLLLQSAAAMSPSEAAFGGQGAASGHDRALSREYLEVALSQVLEAARMAVKFVAEMILEYAKWIAEKTGRAVPVYANTPIAQVTKRTGGTKPAMDVIELKPSWLKSNTEVHTYFENDDADELKRNQLAQQHMQGLVPWDQYREEAWNDPSPEVTLIKIFGDQAIRTPEGRQEIMEFARQLRSDEADQEKERLIKEGLLSPDGLPTRARIPFTPRRVREQMGMDVPTEGGVPDLAAILGGAIQSLNPEAAMMTPAAQEGQRRLGLGADQAQLPPGVIPPPGVPPELLARHMQLDRSHALARAAAAPTGPLGAIGGLANAMPAPPPPGTVPQGPLDLPSSAVPQLPSGVEGPQDIQPYPPQFAAAPTLPGMGGGRLTGAGDVNSALGGVIGGQLRTAAYRYHARKRGPRAPDGR